MLTRVEAAERAGRLRVESYAVELDLLGARPDGVIPAGDLPDRTAPDGGPSSPSGEPAGTFVSTSTITVRVAEPVATFVELRPVELIGAWLDGEALPDALADNRLPLTLTPGRHELVVTARMGYTNSGQGMHRFVDPTDGQTYLHAQSFLDDAQRVFACFDQPDLKASLRLTVLAPPDWLVAANAPGTRRAPGHWVFDPTPPIATYLFSLIAGPYHARHSEHDGIPLGLYCRRSLAEHLDRDADELFGLTAALLDREQELFGTRYPYGRYDQAFLPELNPTAMENVGLVAIREEKLIRRASGGDSDERELRATIMAHEMAHMWFGNLVTMRWWDDLWLNESFAEYLGFRAVSEATHYREAWSAFVLGRKGWGYAADQRPSTHPVAAASIVDTGQALTNFDGISYAKGASVLRQLAAFLGDDAFLAGLRRYIATHAHGNATLDDLLDAFAAASGRDLRDWAGAWLRTSGVNTLIPEPEPAGSVAVAQTGQPPRPHALRVALYRDGALAWQAPVRLAAQPRSVVAGPADRRPGDLLLLNDGDLTYAKIQFDAGSRAALATTLASLDAPLPRALIWSAAIEAVRDGLSTVEEFVGLVEAGLAREPRTETVRELVDLVTHRVETGASPHREVVVRYARPDRLAAAQARLAAALGAAAASGRDRGWRRAALLGYAHASGPDAIADLRRLLSDPGEEFDPDLRWSVLSRLCELGGADQADIEDLARRDTSAQGQVWARRCRACLPDAAVKAQAWHEITTETSLSNRLLLATAEGFWHPAQRELTQSYVERFFAQMPVVARRHAPAVAGKLAGAAFPRFAADEATVGLAEQMLSTVEDQPMLARVVGDWTDELRRVIRARAATGAGDDPAPALTGGTR